MSDVDQEKCTSPTEGKAQTEKRNVCRILSLDGGGAKGFYTLGILREIEALLPRPIHKTFDLIYGTSTGSIIASLLSLGHSVVSRVWWKFEDGVISG